MAALYLIPGALDFRGNQRFILTEALPMLYVAFEEDQMQVYTDKNDLSIFYRTPPPNYSPAELKALERRYFSEELQTTYLLKLVEEQLVVHHPRMVPFALNPIGNNGFLSESWQFNYLKVERNASGEVQGFRVSSSRVRGIKFERLQGAAAGCRDRYKGANTNFLFPLRTYSLITQT